MLSQAVPAFGTLQLCPSFQGMVTPYRASHSSEEGDLGGIFLKENPLFQLKPHYWNSYSRAGLQASLGWGQGQHLFLGLGTRSNSLVPHLDSALEPDLHHSL